MKKVISCENCSKVCETQITQSSVLGAINVHGRKMFVSYNPSGGKYYPAYLNSHGISFKWNSYCYDTEYEAMKGQGSTVYVFENLKELQKWLAE